MDPKTAQEDLAFIRKVIADSRRVAVDNGLDYIIWGLLVSAGMFATVVLELLKVRGYAFLWLWVVVMGGGWIFSLLRHLRKRAHHRVHTLAGSILSSLWLACGITIMVLIFVGGPLLRQSPSPAIAAVLGIGFLVSGVLLDFVYFKVSAVCWWLGSAAMFYLESPWTAPQQIQIHIDILLFAFMMILFQVVPGILLYCRWRREFGRV
jgi:hypothetical protein